jgi:hypothetical protein
MPCASPVKTGLIVFEGNKTGGVKEIDWSSPQIRIQTDHILVSTIKYTAAREYTV